MGLLGWLGLNRGDGYPNLDALMRGLRKALPHDESVLLRYIGTVVVLLGKVAWADGQVTPKEAATLRALLAHIPGLAPAGVDAVCEVLHGKIPSFSDSEMDLVYRELRAICDSAERKQIIRLLLGVAAVEGNPTQAERSELVRISEELGVSFAEVEAEPLDDPPADNLPADDPTQDPPTDDASSTTPEGA